MNRSMMPQQIMSLADGGGISSFIPRNTTIMGQPHYLAYINPQEGQLLKDLGGAGLPGPGGVPTYYELFKPSTWFDGKGYQGTGLNLGGGSTSTSTSDKDDNNDSGPALSASAAAQLNDVRQDENGNWYAVTQVEGSNALGRDYSIDPKDNSQGPTFGGNVSENIAENFPEEVEAAGGSPDNTGSILDTFKNTDVSSLGFNKSTGTFIDKNEVQAEIAKEEGSTTVRRSDGKYYTKYADGTYSEPEDTALGAYYAQEDRENSLKETVANLLTPFDDTEYVGGVLVNKDTGQPVNEAALLNEMGLLPESSDADKTALQTAYEGMYDADTGTGVLGLSGKQVPDAPDYLGNTPIFTYTGGDDRSYEVTDALVKGADATEGLIYDPMSLEVIGVDPSVTDAASMSYNRDGTLFVPYDGKDPYTGEGVNEAAILNVEGQQQLLDTGDDSKMIVKDGQEYVFLDGSETGIQGYDPTGGGSILIQNPGGGGTVLVDPITLEPVYPPEEEPPIEPPVEPPVEPPIEPPVEPPVEPPIEEPPLDTGGDSTVLPGAEGLSLGSTFYGGYQPVTASDVLVANALAETPYVPTTDPRFMPLFQQGADIDKELGIASLFANPASAAMYQGIMS